MGNSLGQPGAVRSKTVGDLLDLTFRLYRERFKFVLLASVCFLLPYSILSALATVQDTTLLQSLMAKLSNQNGPGALTSPGVAGEIATTSGLVVLFSLLDWIVVLPLMYGAILRMVVAQTMEQRTVSFSEAIRFSVRRWPTVLGTLVLIWLVSVVFVLVFGILVGLAAAALSGASQALAISVVVVIAVAATALAFWISVRLSMVSSVIREERIRLWRSVKRSWELTRGNFWRSLGFFILVWLIVVVLQSGVSGAAGLLHSPVLTAVISGIVSLIITPFGMLATANLYVDLRIRTDALDMGEWLPSTDPDVNQ